METQNKKIRFTSQQKKNYLMSFLISIAVLIVVFVIILVVQFFSSANTTKALELIKQGDTYYDEADYEAAIEYYTKAMNADKKNIDARIKLAHTYELNSQSDAAIELILKSVEDAPGSYAYYEYAIQFYVRSGDFEKALNFIDTIKHPPVLLKLNQSRPGNISLDPQAGSYNNFVTVSVFSDSDTKVYYTTDGTTPNASSNVYEKPITVDTEKMTIKLIGINTTTNLISAPITAVYNIYNDAQTYTFMDSKIEQIVRATLKKPTDQITYKEIASIVELSNIDEDGNAIEGYIRNLSDLEVMSSLSSINFVNEAALANFNVFESLQSLRSLTLTNCAIDNNDFQQITQAKSLEIIKLDNNQITDISSLVSLDNLQHLSLSSNQISDLSPLEVITSIKTLNLSSNKINNIEALSGFSALSTLNLASNELTDISPVFELVNLKELDASENQISDISGIKSMKGLKKLVLSANPLENLSPLEDFNTLEQLELAKNNISDLSSLEGLQLKKLILTNCNITNISSLGYLTKLEYLDLKNTTTDTNIIPYINNIVDITPLSKLKNLQVLMLNMNQNLVDISALTKCTSLKNLYLIKCSKVNDEDFRDKNHINIYK
ncbi:MAG: tetratricopeptide repeat protein [Ruminococcaceae bacterium]|nr:tetratricopeptide repeat protein [Oscillospiraceae bacterium]